MVWPFRSKPIPAPRGRKSAAYLFNVGLGRAGLTGAAYDRLAAEGYAQCVVAFACINMLAAAVASVEPRVFKADPKTGKPLKIDAHPLLALVQNPNPAQSGKEFVRHLVSHHRLSGNAYVWGNGLDPAARKPKPPTQLQLLDPGKVKVIPGALLPARYEFKPAADQPAVLHPVDQVSGRSAVLHLKAFNPLSQWYGMSPLEAAALGVDIHNDGQRWNKRLIENGARPSGALVVKGGDGQPNTLSEDQYDRLKAMIDDQFSGSGNAGRPMLLEGGLDWQEMSLNPKDMDFLEGKNSAARDIALAFGVPPQLLGIPGDNTYSNYAEAKLAFWTDTVLPLLGVVNDGFNRWLAPLYGDGVYLWYDEETVPALEPLRKAKFDRLKTADWLTVNEKRRASGEDDIAGGDAVFVPSLSVPLGTPAPSTSAVTQPDPDAAAKHRSWLVAKGYTADRADRLARLVYG